MLAAGFSISAHILCDMVAVKIGKLRSRSAIARMAEQLCLDVHTLKASCSNEQSQKAQSPGQKRDVDLLLEAERGVINRVSCLADAWSASKRELKKRGWMGLCYPTDDER